ncbi:MAG: hypothetical protein RMJ59_00065 [Candidatus Nitrosocaldus sp.]|nr:hypothetical protein [Candidatus Nitrosocaldus sp.]
MQSNELKKVLLDMLDKDTEFRHAVAGLIGYKEILDRIASLEDRVVKLEERIVKLEERTATIEEEIRNLRRDMLEGFRRQDRRLRYIESFMENLSLSVEEEAREVVEYWLRQKGITLKVTNLRLPDVEVDIYAVDTDLCIVGEAKTRAARKAIMQVERSISRLCKKHPQYVRGRVVKVVYAIQAMPEAIEEARKRNIWLVTAKGELTELRLQA